jgi:hypothetical protein
LAVLPGGPFRIVSASGPSCGFAKIKTDKLINKFSKPSGKRRNQDIEVNMIPQLALPKSCAPLLTYRWVNSFNIVGETIVAVFNIRRRHLEMVAGNGTSSSLSITPAGSSVLPSGYGRLQPPDITATDTSVEQSGLGSVTDYQQQLLQLFCVDLVSDQTCFDFWKVVYDTSMNSSAHDENGNGTDEAEIDDGALSDQHTAKKNGSNSTIHEFLKVSARRATQMNMGGSGGNSTLSTPRLPQMSARSNSNLGAAANPHASSRESSASSLKNTSTPRKISTPPTSMTPRTPRSGNANGNAGKLNEDGADGSGEYRDETFIQEDDYEDGFDDDENAEASQWNNGSSSNNATKATPEQSETSAHPDNRTSMISRASSMPHLRGAHQHFLHHVHDKRNSHEQPNEVY